MVLEGGWLWHDLHHVPSQLRWHMTGFGGMGSSWGHITMEWMRGLLLTTKRRRLFLINHEIREFILHMGSKVAPQTTFTFSSVEHLCKTFSIAMWIIELLSQNLWDHWLWPFDQKTNRDLVLINFSCICAKFQRIPLQHYFDTAHMTMGRTSHSSCHQCRGLKMHQRTQTGKKLRKSYFWNCPVTCSDQHYYSSKPKSVILSKFFTSPQNRVHPQQTRRGRGTRLALVPVQIQNSSPQQSYHLGSQCCILQLHLSDFVFKKKNP